MGSRFGGDSFGAKIVRSSAQLIADGATRSLIEGTDFGDNIMAALPNAIGSLVGESLAGAISYNGTTKPDGPKQALDPKAALCQAAQKKKS